MIAPDPFYMTHPECLISVFDLRECGGAEALHKQRAIWVEHSDLEALDEDHLVLVVRPGWVSEAA
jgi:hypothetical protein